jgi:hypothetical protein
MRSQVQVLAGPPLIVAGHSAAGSGPGAFAVGLGRAGAARPIPPAPPVAPPGPPTRPSGSATTTHRGQAPAEDGSQVAGAATSRCSLLPRPPRSRPPRALPTPAWPAWSLSGQARPPRPAPNPAARVRHRPPTDQSDVGSVARVPASWTVDRAVDGPGAAGASTGSGGHGRPATSTWVSQRHRLSMGGDGRVRTDGGRHQTVRTLDGGQQTAERRTRWTTTPGDQTPDGWTAGSRTPERDGWTPPAGHTGDRRRGVAAGRVDHGDDARPLDPGWTLLRADAVWASNNQDRSAARTSRAPTLRMGLATAATVSCRWYAAVQLAPWRTALLDDSGRA